MRSATNHVSISTARADALFASALQRSDEPSAAQVRQAIAGAVRAFGARGCAARVAQAYGEHPEIAVLRMRWARAMVKGDGVAWRGDRRCPARAGPCRRAWSAHGGRHLPRSMSGDRGRALGKPAMAAATAPALIGRDREVRR